MSVSATDHSKIFLTLVVNNSTGAVGVSFGVFSSVLDALKTYTTTGMFNSSACEVRFILTSVLYEFMVRYSDK